MKSKKKKKEGKKERKKEYILYSINGAAKRSWGLPLKKTKKKKKKLVLSQL